MLILVSSARASSSHNINAKDVQALKRQRVSVTMPNESKADETELELDPVTELDNNYLCNYSRQLVSNVMPDFMKKVHFRHLKHSGHAKSFDRGSHFDLVFAILPYIEIVMLSWTEDMILFNAIPRRDEHDEIVTSFYPNCSKHDQAVKMDPPEHCSAILFEVAPPRPLMIGVHGSEPVVKLPPKPTGVEAINLWKVRGGYKWGQFRFRFALEQEQIIHQTLWSDNFADED